MISEMKIMFPSIQEQQNTITHPKKNNTKNTQKVSCKRSLLKMVRAFFISNSILRVFFLLCAHFSCRLRLKLLKNMNSAHFSYNARIFLGKRLPEEGCVVGYASIISKLNAPVPLPDQNCMVCNQNKKYETDQWKAFAVKYFSLSI